MGWAGTIYWAICFHLYSPNIRWRKYKFSRQHFKKMSWTMPPILWGPPIMLNPLSSNFVRPPPLLLFLLPCLFGWMCHHATSNLISPLIWYHIQTNTHMTNKDQQTDTHINIDQHHLFCAHSSYLYYLLIQKFTLQMSTCLSFCFKNNSLAVVIYLLIRFNKTKSFLVLSVEHKEHKENHYKRWGGSNYDYSLWWIIFGKTSSLAKNYPSQRIKTVYHWIQVNHCHKSFAILVVSLG